MLVNRHASLAGAAILGLLAADAALAQQTAQAQGGLEEIVVTARRREENVQSVPVAVNAFSAEAIREKNITSVVALQAMTPSYNANNFQGRESSLTPHLRSLPGVRTYFAEAPSPISGLGAFYDLQNVQVLVGPQGTLFGLNAVGGAVLREPKRPTNQFEGYIQGSYGSYNQREVEGAINVPIVDDKLMVRFAGDRQVRDGFTKRLGSDEKQDNRNYTALRGSFTVKPWEGIENYFVYDYRYSSTNGSSYFLKNVKPSGPGAFAALVFGLPTLQAQIAQQEALGRFTNLALTLPDQMHRNRTSIMVDTLTVELNDQFTFKNIASRGSVQNVENHDEDGSPLSLLDLVAPDGRLNPAQVTWTEEPQLQGRLLDGKLNMVAGAFYQYVETPHPRTTCNGFANFGALPNCSFGSGAGNGANEKYRTQGLFAQGTLDLGALSDGLDGFKFTAGYRYNWDFYSQYNKNTNRLTGACTNAAADSLCQIEQNAKWKAPGFTFALDYQVTPDTLVYATTRRAYTTGLLNAAQLPAALRVVDPQTNTDVEVGIKSDWRLGDMRARTNLALFNNWFRNIQELTTGLFTDAQGVQRSTGVTLNASKATIKGADLQLQLLPTPWLEIGFNYQYLLAQYDSYPSISPVTLLPVDLSTRSFPAAPKHTGAVSAKVHLPIAETLGTASVGAVYQFMTSFALVTDGAPDVYQTRKQLDLRIDWNDVGGYPIDFAVSAINVTQSKYTVASFNPYNSLGISLWVYSEPRAFTASVRYRFGGDAK